VDKIAVSGERFSLLTPLSQIPAITKPLVDCATAFCGEQFRLKNLQIYDNNVPLIKKLSTLWQISCTRGDECF
jgi:hypothetical protein